jgi:hypothetical protein
MRIMGSIEPGDHNTGIPVLWSPDSEPYKILYKNHVIRFHMGDVSLDFFF